MNAKQIWQTALERLQTKVQPAVFTTWFQGTSAGSFQNGIFVVYVPTTFARAHLEGRFLDIIRSILTEITGGPVEVQFVVAKDPPSAPLLSAGTVGGQGEPKGSRDGRKQDLPADAPALSASPPVAKRPYRLPKNRPVTLSPAKSASFIGGQTEPASPPISMNSIAPASSRHAVHRSPDSEEQAKTGRQIEMPLSTKKQLSSAPLHGSVALLNPRYTFDAFIVGKSNQLAHAASLAVAENPGRIYNPLFLYGGVGLGKTHLMHAVGHMGEAVGLNVLYVTSEKFTNEIINAIRYQKTEEFRTKYRQIDILLVDDIQFIAGKESTEEEFFHTFNTLYDANKQIVVTSDRPPRAIHSLQDRLRSRFEWGLLADIQAPEYEHRLAILRSKADSVRFAIPASVIEYIARPECGSVRELEGSLNRVIAYATLHDAPLSVSLAAKALEDLYIVEPRSHTTLTIQEVLDAVCKYYNVELERLKSKQRDREIAWPRQVAMYVMRGQTNTSLFQIGSALGGRDHTTVLHGCEKVQAEMANNDHVRREIATLLEMFRSQ